MITATQLELIEKLKKDIANIISRAISHWATDEDDMINLKVSKKLLFVLDARNTSNSEAERIITSLETAKEYQDFFGSVVTNDLMRASKWSEESEATNEIKIKGLKYFRVIQNLSVNWDDGGFWKNSSRCIEIISNDWTTHKPKLMQLINEVEEQTTDETDYDENTKYFYSDEQQTLEKELDDMIEDEFQAGEEEAQFTSEAGALNIYVPSGYKSKAQHLAAKLDLTDQKGNYSISSLFRHLIDQELNS